MTAKSVVRDCPKCGTPRDEENTDCCDDYEVAELREALAAKEAEVDRLAGERDHFKAWCANREERVAELESKSIRYQIDLDNRARVAESRAEAAEAQVKTLTGERDRLKNEADLCQVHAERARADAAEAERDALLRAVSGTEQAAVVLEITRLTEERDALVGSVAELQRQVRDNTSAHMKLAQIRTEERDAARAEVEAGGRILAATQDTWAVEMEKYLATRREADRLREALAEQAVAWESLLAEGVDPMVKLFAATAAKSVRDALANTSEPAPREKAMCSGCGNVFGCVCPSESTPCASCVRLREALKQTECRCTRCLGYCESMAPDAFPCPKDAALAAASEEPQ
jgi:hypothetical protein